MKKILYTLLSVLILCSMELNAQVTIGDDNAPHDFSILELISGKTAVGGLRMPHLSENEIIKLTDTSEFQAEKNGKAMGLTVFNTTSKCIEYWNGTEWIERCDEECCTAPDSPCPITFSFPRTLPLWLNDEFTASVTAVAGLTYAWTVPSSMSVVETNGNTVKIRATTPGTHSLANIGVTATNDCGSVSVVCTGKGEVKVLDCDRAPSVSLDANLANVKVQYAKSGSGTAGDPYIVEVGNSIQITYENPVQGINYEWYLDAEGQNYFEVVSSTAGMIVLRAKEYNVDGTPCSDCAIRLRLTNDCGYVESCSSIRVKITGGTVPCVVPDAPSSITFSKTTMLVGETFTASIASVAGATSYTWMLSAALSAGVEIIAGAGTTTITLRAKLAGTYGRSGLSVTANNNCGPSAQTNGGSGVLIINEPSILPDGTGAFKGKICFDIAKSNDSKYGCGALSGRYSQRTDFTLRTPQDPAAGSSSAPYTGVQIYTFKPSTTVSNLRFVVEDVNGAVLSYTPNADYSGTIAAQAECKVTVYFDPALNTRLLGLTRNQAWKVYILAIYTENGVDKVVRLTLSLQDCACCGAKTNNSGGWLNFMCHNLGADESLDPFTYNTNLKGDLYQWGRIDDGHEKRTSSTSKGQASGSQLNADGQATGSKKGYFITWGSNGSVGGNNTNWRLPKDDTLWSDSQKTKGDPCPPGWKVPSSSQWQAVVTYNNPTWTTNGYKLGDALYLPAAGTRGSRYGNLTSHPEVASQPFGYYWSSTPTDVADSVTKGIGGYHLGFFNHNIYVSPTINAPYRSQGMTVRCVEE